jgi:phosphoribosylformylglycinamidine synthase subunit PurQ / glutaminase
MDSEIVMTQSTCVHFLILTGDGINCAKETAWGFELAGGKATIVHISDLLNDPEQLLLFDGMALPGGFSFGDALGAGHVLALKMKHGLGDSLKRFVEQGAPIIGICNGFQVLLKLGLLPNIEEDRSMALAPNRQGVFIDRWVDLQRPVNSVCKWTSGLERLTLPIRHGEGRVVFDGRNEAQGFAKLWSCGQVALQYTEDVNGSHGRIAGVCDPTGLILGLMPHPEAHLFAVHRPTIEANAFEEGDGLQLFRTIIRYCKDRRLSTKHNA